jgi:predicted nucleotidyltransferase
MTSYERPDREKEGEFIHELKDLVIDNIEEEVKSSVEYGADVDRSMIDSIYIFGSWARGTAIEGESDLDIAVFFKEGVRDMDYTWESAMVSDSMEMGNPMVRAMFEGFDVLLFDGKVKDETIQEKMTESRSGRFEGEQQVYNLTKRRYENG